MVLVEETISKVHKTKEGKRFNLAATVAVNDLARRKKKYQQNVPKKRAEIIIKPDLPEEKSALPRSAGDLKPDKTQYSGQNRFLIEGKSMPRPSVKERLGSKNAAKPSPTFQQEAMMDAILGAMQEKEAKEGH